MKVLNEHILILIVCVIVISSFCSCTPHKNLTVIADHELRDEQWREFNAISEHFRKNVFPVCTEQLRLRMSCSGCEYIYIIFRIEINAGGRLTGCTKVGENVCGGKAPAALERCFVEYLESITFPRKLRSMIIQTRLGTGLKC
ncbi:MAG TPA: hypothetical protein PK307_09065 [Spirochaetota bacterium]|nr:hypothetical protein [Spirochaetota bacterium]HPN12526.1 hypothetical protein [Spirochaetota bacterium]HQL82337.1 hypothetical protein [Spirochaetota bacterium]